MANDTDCTEDEARALGNELRSSSFFIADLGRAAWRLGARPSGHRAPAEGKATILIKPEEWKEGDRSIAVVTDFQGGGQTWCVVERVVAL